MTESFRKLSEYLLKRLDHSDEQAVMLGYEVYSKASEENYRISEVLQMIYQVGRKIVLRRKDCREDPEQSEKVKISKESEVSEQENFEDLCSEDRFSSRKNQNTRFRKILRTSRLRSREKKAFLKMRMICREGRINIEDQAEQKKQIQNKKTTA